MKIISFIFVFSFSALAFAQQSPLPYDVSTWQVGDQLTYQINAGGGWGVVGTFSKRVVRATVTSVWVESDWVFPDFSMWNSKTLAELSKSDSQMVDLYVDNQQKPPDVMSLVPMRSGQAHVPAGAFDCTKFHLITTGETAGASHMVLCMNSKAIGMDGTAQMQATWLGRYITYDLISFTSPHTK